jgi:ABC-2 type transport system permease protein
MGAIYRRELGAFFSSAIGPVFLTFFYLGSGLLFWLFCLNYAITDMSNYFAWMRLIMVLVLPLLTMRLLSEERAQKTDQGLLTAPVSLGGIVLGKYFAALTVYAMGIAIVFVYAILLSFFGTVAWSIVLSNFIALFLMGAAFMAITLFLSAFTANQFISYILGIVALVVLYVIDYLSGTITSTAETVSASSTFFGVLLSGLGAAMESISFFSRIYDFTYGLFNLSSVLLYVSAAVLFNFFTVRVFETRRWR